MKYISRIIISLSFILFKNNVTNKGYLTEYDTKKPSDSKS